MEDFCTFGRHAPHDAKVQSFQEDVYAQIKTIHEVFDSDAEQTMVLCGMDLAGALLPRDRRSEAYYPNNKLLIKDPTHAARRTLERPWRPRQKFLCTNERAAAGTPTTSSKNVSFM